MPPSALEPVVLEPLRGAAVLARSEVAPFVLDLLHAVTLNTAATNTIHRTFFMGVVL